MRQWDCTEMWGASQNVTQATLQYRNFCMFVELLQWSLDYTASMTQLFRRLLSVAPTEEAAERLEHMLQEERKHTALFEALYAELRGEQPEFNPEPILFGSYDEGIRQAVRHSRDALKHYRDTYLITPSQRIRDTFFLALSDKMEHLTALIQLERSC
jgi:rubrerythrin